MSQKKTRITPAEVNAMVVLEQYHHFPGTTLTVCAITLPNGHTLTGESGCICPESFDLNLGKAAARERAMSKVWELAGYDARTENARLVTADNIPAAN